MYLVTGGEGFIGSSLVTAFVQRQLPVAVCDVHCGRYLHDMVRTDRVTLVRPEHLLRWLDDHEEQITLVCHFAANTLTTETDWRELKKTNIDFSNALFLWCCRTSTRFIYASSAATYGDGSFGYDDSHAEEYLAKLSPLNPYAWSKHIFDCALAARVARGEAMPPQWIGLKFFNVYGGNEGHKAAMRSPIAKGIDDIHSGRPIRLFRTETKAYSRALCRDFVYVMDCVSVVMWMVLHPEISGVFNVGTGEARSWEEVADALFRATGLNTGIEPVDFPEGLVGRYQYWTQASLWRLRSVGYSEGFATIEEGIQDLLRRRSEI